jgi:adenylate cyclase
MRKRGRIRLLLLAAVAAVAVAAGLVAHGTNLFQSLELSTLDARFSVRGDQKPPKDLVVVGVDGRTLQDLDEQWPYPRRLHGQVIDRLREDGAKVIAFDVVFAEPSREKLKFCPYFGADFQPNDCALATAAAKAKNVVFSATEVGKNGNVRMFGASGKEVLPVLKARAGYTGIADDSDGSIRRFLYGYRALKSFAVVAVEKEGGKIDRSAFRDDGSAYVDFVGGPGSIPEVSYSKVLRGETKPGYFRGKTVVVGATNGTLKDVFHTATSGDELMSGPELQAQAIVTVRNGNPLRDASSLVDILLIVGLGLVAPVASAPWRLRGLGLAVIVGALFVVAAFVAFNNDRIIAFVYPLLALVIGLVGSLAAQYFTETRERQRTKLLFSRFVPENVVDQVLDRADDDLRLGGVQREGTVMFSDLRGFTSFAEALPVERVIEVLNRYLGEMSEAILNNGGTLVAYMGDGIMAVFGAPIEQPDHADRALTAAREMLGPRLATFNQYLRDEGLGEGFRMGVGLNSGHVMSGNVGSERRLEYTAIGDTTNTAARLEGMTKGTPHQLYMAESTRAFLRSAPDDLVDVGEFEVRGRTQKIKLWSIPDAGSAPPLESEAPAAPAAPA